MVKIPNQFRKEVDLLKDELVNRLFEHTKTLKGEMINFKNNCFDEIDAYLSILNESYKAPYEGKGNITLVNIDSTKKIQINVAEFIQFDEKLQVAKNLIDKCIAKWIDGSRDEIKALVNFAFEVDKQGRVSKDRVLTLRKVHIQDEDWQNAMQAINDSIVVTNSKTYIKFYERKDSYSQWQHVSLNIAAL